MRAEAGTLEYFKDANQQLRCAGFFPIHVVIYKLGLLRPRYTNGGALYFIVQGRGVVGITFPGCPETPYRRPFTAGDVIALPAGVPIWIYNDGSTPVEFVVAFTVGGQQANLFDTQHRDFNFAGSNGNRSRTIFHGFTEESLRQSLGLSRDLVARLQGETDRRGTIVRASNGLFPTPQPEKNQLNDTMAAHHELQAGSEEQEDVLPLPGDDKMCRMKKVTMNLGPTMLLTGRELPILKSVGLSILRGTLKPNGIVSPRYDIDAQSLVYVTRGSVTVQVVDNRGDAVFAGVLRQGQPLVVPRYYVILAQAGKDGAEYVVFKTDANPVESIVGSVLRSLPVGVIAAAYDVSASDAIKIKNNNGVN